jgi:hypothetical protein
MEVTNNDLAAADLIVLRAEQRFAAHEEEIHKRTDRMFAVIMGVQWILAIIIAILFSPYGWEGKIRSIHIHVYLAVFLGAAISSLPIALALLKPGKPITRHVIAAGQILWSALLIHLTGGRIETHFHVFGSLGILAFYRDWKVLGTATVVVAADHLIRGILWPESVYGIVNPEWWRFLEHAFWVVFSISFLAISCRHSIQEMRLIAERGAQMEALSEGEWLKTSVLERSLEQAQEV